MGWGGKGTAQFGRRDGGCVGDGDDRSSRLASAALLHDSLSKPERREVHLWPAPAKAAKLSDCGDVTCALPGEISSPPPHTLLNAHRPGCLASAGKRVHAYSNPLSLSRVTAPFARQPLWEDGKAPWVCVRRDDSGEQVPGYMSPAALKNQR
ncbi:hypothetical protein AC579_2694 [Pseudocercospora musae]|uniref:Uncharacterized protein n=1 Tax=Pseudocercospora musae TaxID=113226 RepID=A0A139IVD1_9PEZI|nr:hypothetical protein AC579_2694 [Pseudocercospora musae]